MPGLTVSKRFRENRPKRWLAATLLLGVVLLGAGCASNASPPGGGAAEDGSREFEDLGFKTDTSKRSVELGEFISGGPAKDVIPDLTRPKYEPIAESTIPDDVRGALVEVGDDKRFFPYNVMVWHEIVNDVVGGKPVAVTF